MPFDFKGVCICVPQSGFENAYFTWCVVALACVCLGVCVCGVVFVVFPPFSAGSAPMLLARSLGKCLLLVCLAFSCFMFGSLWAILLGILTCQTPCVICMDFIRVGHGARAPNFPKHFPHQILHAQPPFQNNENLPFLCLGGGCLRIGIVLAGGVHQNAPFSKNPCWEILLLLFLFF